MASGRRVDVVVVGAGTAGANAAYQLASTGRSVVVLERRGAGAGGAQWHNGVLDWQFERAGLPVPVAPERGLEGRTAHVFGPDGTHGATVTDSPPVVADMALLGERLRSLALEAGAELIADVGDLTVDVAGDRIVAVESAGRRFEAALFVDASGRHGLLRGASPQLARLCPPVGGAELCAAGDYTLRIDDVDGARRFLDRHGAQVTDSVNSVGRNGGWSTRSISVQEGLGHVTVLVGCIATGAHGTPAKMLAETRADEPWIGDQVDGATGLIPLRRPYARLSAPGVALVGDAAAQMFPAHGSGIGVGLIAGRILAEAVADAADPGDPTVLWGYQAAFHRELGGLLAAYDALRRMSTALGTGGVTAMVRTGLLDADTVRDGLDQRWGAPPPSKVPAMALRLARSPRVAATMLPWLARAQLALGHGGRYPLQPDEAALDRWERRMARLLGKLPGG